MKIKAANEIELTQRISVIERLNYLNILRTEDTHSIALLQGLLNGFPFLPFTRFTFRPSSIVHIINDILLNRRKDIIEFGTGISTVIMARLIKKNNLNSRIFSIEHNADWVDDINNMLRVEKLEEVVTVINAPLCECNLAINKTNWYDSNILSKVIGEREFDMVIIDGPPAWEESNMIARYPALPFIMGNLSQNYSIFLDDANRGGEKAIMKLWEDKFKIKFIVRGGTLAYCQKGKFFDSAPFNF